MEVETLSPLLAFKNGSVVTNSRDVAAFFEKNVRHVHEAIRNLRAQEPEFADANFRPNEINDLTGVSVYSFDMIRDGFTLLAMGFAGSKALKFKIAYINQFNAMEAELRNREEDEVAPGPEAKSRLLVGEARRTFGVKAAQQLWGHLGLPVVPAMLVPSSSTQMGFAFG